jgi:hypothetical protein
MMDRMIRETSPEAETGSDVLMDRTELPRDLPSDDRPEDNMFPQPRPDETGLEDEVVPGDSGR